MQVNSRPRILFMGTPDFAVPSLLALLQDERVDVIGVVTQPDRPKGRKQVLTPPPVKAEAVKHGLDIFQPEKLRAPDSVERVRAFKPDLIVTAAYGQILPKAILELPTFGCINVHASLLPKYRGGAPIHRSIIDGQPETGVTIMYMAEGLDTGDMISRVVVSIEESDTTGTMHDKLSIAGAELLKDTIGPLLSGQAQAAPQDHEAATYAPNLSRDDERIDWSKPSRAIYDQVRGLNPWPVAFTLWDEAVFKVWACRILRQGEHSSAKHAPGTVLLVDGQGIEVATGDGSVLLTEIQPAGKKRMSGEDFARGSRMEQGTRLGGQANS